MKPHDTLRRIEHLSGGHQGAGYGCCPPTKVKWQRPQMYAATMVDFVLTVAKIGDSAKFQWTVVTADPFQGTSKMLVSGWVKTALAGRKAAEKAANKLAYSLSMPMKNLVPDVSRRPKTRGKK